jgi:hypothetical protein
MKPRLRYSWQNHRWDGRLLSPMESVRFAALDSVDRDQFIRNIVADMRAKQDMIHRRTARFRERRV